MNKFLIQLKIINVRKRITDSATKFILAIIRCRLLLLVIGILMGCFSLMMLNFKLLGDYAHYNWPSKAHQNKGIRIIDISRAKTWENHNENQQLSPSLAFKLGVFKAIGSLKLELAAAEDAAHLEPAAWKKPEVKKRILILATWRSGSTFIGELIRSSPGVFYSFEPLNYLQYDLGPYVYNRTFVINTKEVLAMKPMKYIRSYFSCQFSPDYLDHITLSQPMMKHNKRVWDICQSVDPELCLQPEFVKTLCNQFPIHLIKEVRLGLNHIEQDGLLDSDDPYLIGEWKVIYLVRDPRAIMASRAPLSWCQDDPACQDVRHLCSNMQRDLILLESLKTRNPERYYLLDYEEFTKDVEIGTEKLFDFLGLTVTAPVKNFLDTHTRRKTDEAESNPYSTRRLSKNAATAWRNRLSTQNISDISSKCLDVLKFLNYPLF